MYDLIENEKVREHTSINLLPTEIVTSVVVIEALGSIFANKNSERYGKKSYGAITVINRLEDLCASRVIYAFDLDPSI